MSVGLSASVGQDCLEQATCAPARRRFLGLAMHVTPFRAYVELGTQWLKSPKGKCFGRAGYKTSNLKCLQFVVLGAILSVWFCNFLAVSKKILVLILCYLLAVSKKMEMAENI